MTVVFVIIVVVVVIIIGVASEGEIKCDPLKQFMCDELQCIEPEQKCNGVTECRNGRDEGIPVCGCEVDEFQCNSTSCIDVIKRCDRFADCPDGIDESDCDVYECPSTHVKCDNHFCVPRDEQCDHKDDCGDNSDEASCDYRDCFGSEWRCANEECIPNNYLCDGLTDCIDGTDEINCEIHTRCENGLYVSANHTCDGWVDCVDSQTDEENCGVCGDHQMMCNNSRCIPLSNRCDSVCDCGSTCDDERNCHALSSEEFPPSSPPAPSSSFSPSSWVCLLPAGERFVCLGARRCVRRAEVGNGRNDCWDSHIGEDEEYCVASEDECIGIPCNNGFRLRNETEHHKDCNNTINCPQFGTWNQMNHCLAGRSGCIGGGEEKQGVEDGKERAERNFSCTSGHCIGWSGRCNGIVDCEDMSDELDCVGHRCPAGARQCESSGQCIADNRWCDFFRDCLDGSDEEACPETKCSETQFRCRNHQCVNRADLCLRRKRENGGGRTTGCADNSHLLQCKDFSCPVGWFKCRNSYCVPLEHVCDGTIDCETTHTDELNCPYDCPYPVDVCICLDSTMNCTGKDLSAFPPIANERGQHHKIFFSHNRLNESLDARTFRDFGHVKFLDISFNSIENVFPNYFQPLWRLTTLNLEHNRMRKLTNGTFQGLANVNTLYLGGNVVEVIEPFSFLGLPSLKALDLSGQNLRRIPRNAFVGLRNVYALNLSNNAIVFLADGAFNGLHRLKVLDISKNFITEMDLHVFSGLQLLQTLVTDEFRFCCLATGPTNCFPRPDEFSTCEDLMSNFVLRTCIWVLGLVSLAGNSVVIIWRLKDSRDSRVHSFLITNMAAGDLMMGVYLLIIASVDLNYRGVYGAYDSLWRASGLCRFAGFLSTYSSEISVVTLVVITLDRFVSIIFPFRTSRLGMREARLVMAALWTAVLVLAALPLSEVDYFRNFYGRSGVCLALHITPAKPSGWEYSVFVFLALNFVLFLVIFVSYLWMFVVAKRTHSAARSTQMKNDRAMARRMTLIVMADFFCWFPIILLGVASLNGATIPPQTFAWIAVFVLPLNAAVNPLLYTMSTSRFVGHARHRVFKFRKSFISSLVGMADTKPTLVSTDDNCPGGSLDDPPQSSRDLVTIGRGALPLKQRHHTYSHLPLEPYPGKMDARRNQRQHHQHLLNQVQQQAKKDVRRHQNPHHQSPHHQLLLNQVQQQAKKRGTGGGAGGGKGARGKTDEPEMSFDQQSIADSRLSPNTSSSYETIQSLNY